MGFTQQGVYMSELMLPQVINTEQLPALFGVRENGKSGIESI